MAWLLLTSLSEPTDVTRFTYPDAAARGDAVSATANVPVFGQRELGWMRAFLTQTDHEVRAAVVNALSSYATYLRDDPVADIVLERLEDPACTYAALAWARYRTDLVPTSRLRAMLSTTSRPGPVWRVLVERGEIEAAIEAFATADSAMQEDLVFALSDFGKRRGREFLVACLESESTDKAIRQSIVSRFRERGERAVVRRFEHLFGDA